MKTKLVVVVSGILAAVPAMAHHSFAAEFDFKKPVALPGTGNKSGLDQAPRAFLRGCEECRRQGRELGD